MVAAMSHQTHVQSLGCLVDILFTAHHFEFLSPRPLLPHILKLHFLFYRKMEKKK